MMKISRLVLSILISGSLIIGLGFLSLSDTSAWQDIPVCDPPPCHTHTPPDGITNTPEPNPEVTNPAPTEEITPIPACTIVARPHIGIIIRQAPSVDAPEVGLIQRGQTAPITGAIISGTISWYPVVGGWVSSEAVDSGKTNLTGCYTISATPETPSGPTSTLPPIIATSCAELADRVRLQSEFVYQSYVFNDEACAEYQDFQWDVDYPVNGLPADITQTINTQCPEQLPFVLQTTARRLDASRDPGGQINATLSEAIYTALRNNPCGVVAPSLEEIVAGCDIRNHRQATVLAKIRATQGAEQDIINLYISNETDDSACQMVRGFDQLGALTGGQIALFEGLRVCYSPDVSLELTLHAIITGVDIDKMMGSNTVNLCSLDIYAVFAEFYIVDMELLLEGVPSQLWNCDITIILLYKNHIAHLETIPQRRERLLNDRDVCIAVNNYLVYGIFPLNPVETTEPTITPGSTITPNPTEISRVSTKIFTERDLFKQTVADIQTGDQNSSPDLAIGVFVDQNRIGILNRNGSEGRAITASAEDITLENPAINQTGNLIVYFESKINAPLTLYCRDLNAWDQGSIAIKFDQNYELLPFQFTWLDNTLYITVKDLVQEVTGIYELQFNNSFQRCQEVTHGGFTEKLPLPQKGALEPQNLMGTNDGGIIFYDTAQGLIIAGATNSTILTFPNDGRCHNPAFNRTILLYKCEEKLVKRQYQNDTITGEPELLANNVLKGISQFNHLAAMGAPGYFTFDDGTSTYILNLNEQPESSNYLQKFDLGSSMTQFYWANPDTDSTPELP